MNSTTLSAADSQKHACQTEVQDDALSPPPATQFEKLREGPAVLTVLGNASCDLSAQPANFSRKRALSDSADAGIPVKRETLADRVPIFSASGPPMPDDINNPQPLATNNTWVPPSFNPERGDMMYGLYFDRQRLYGALAPPGIGNGFGTRHPPNKDNITYINHAMSRLFEYVCAVVFNRLESRALNAQPDFYLAHGAVRSPAIRPTKKMRETALRIYALNLSAAELQHVFDAAYGDITAWPYSGYHLMNSAAGDAGQTHKNLLLRMCELSISSSRHDRRYDWPQSRFSEELDHCRLTTTPSDSPGKRTAVARISKLGIITAAMPDTTHHIHFALDNIDMEAVVRKTGAHGNSITASELRSAHRLGKAITGRLHFYLNGQPCPAPWIDNPALWSERQPKRQMNFSGLLTLIP